MFFDEPTSAIKKTPKINTPGPAWAMWLVVAVLAFISGAAGALVVQTYLGGAASLPAINEMVGRRTVTLQEESSTTAAVKNVSPSVVSIIITKDVSKLYSNSPFDQFFGPNSPFNFFFNGQPVQPQQPQTPEGKQEIGGGTGFVIDSAKGLILTNRHVVDDTEAEYTVLTNDGNRYEATVVARDTLGDMAIVQITNHNIPQVTLGDSDGVQLGQTVIAIGNALGEYRNTITKGVVSGIGRNIVAGDNRGSSENLEGVFQTDAAINPGNSGGPLVNLQGQVIGMNTAVSQQGQLIGFAIPINEAKRMISSYAKYGRIVRPFLGVRYTLITPEYAKANNLSVEYGALIVKGDQTNGPSVLVGSPAEKAGLKELDIILEVNGQKIDSGHSLARLLAQFNPGDNVKLKVLRDEKNIELTAVLEEYKE